MSDSLQFTTTTPVFGKELRCGFCTGTGANTVWSGVQYVMRECEVCAGYGRIIVAGVGPERTFAAFPRIAKLEPPGDPPKETANV